MPSTVGSVIRKSDLKWVCGQIGQPNPHPPKPLSCKHVWDLQRGCVDAKPGTVWLMSHELAAPRDAELCAPKDITVEFWQCLDNAHWFFFSFYFCRNFSRTARNQNLIPHQIAPGFKSALRHAEQPIKLPLLCHADGCSWYTVQDQHSLKLTKVSRVFP